MYVYIYIYIFIKVSGKCKYDMSFMMVIDLLFKKTLDMKRGKELV